MKAYRRGSKGDTHDPCMLMDASLLEFSRKINSGDACRCPANRKTRENNCKRLLLCSLQESLLQILITTPAAVVAAAVASVAIAHAAAIAAGICWRSSNGRDHLVYEASNCHPKEEPIPSVHLRSRVL